MKCAAGLTCLNSKAQRSFPADSRASTEGEVQVVRSRMTRSGLQKQGEVELRLRLTCLDAKFNVLSITSTLLVQQPAGPRS